MIVVRNVFRIRFGQAREATDLWKQAAGVFRQMGLDRIRILTDIAGPPFYTMVLETTHDSLADWEKDSKALRASAAWKEVYQKICAITEEGRREILSTVA